MPLQDAIRKFFRDMVRTRNIIIVSDRRVRHYPVSPSMQAFGALGIAALIGWASYATGGLMAAHDYFMNHQVVAAAVPQVSPEERIAELEHTVQTLRQDKQALITSVRQTTDQKIEELENVITSTGLSPDTMSEKAKKEVRKETKNQGGPFVSANQYSDLEQRQIIGELQHLMTLNHVVERLPLGRPITAAAQYMSGFGYRSDPFNGEQAMHTGIDFSGPRSTGIMATNAGRVTFAGWHPEYGNMVDISHGVGITTRYGHMSKLLVHTGDMVEKGTIVGLQGSTGRSTGAHLHYEVRLNDKPLNPRPFVEASRKVN